MRTQRGQDGGKQGCCWLLTSPTRWIWLLPEAEAQGEMPQGSNLGRVGSGWGWGCPCCGAVGLSPTFHPCRAQPMSTLALT